MTNPTKAAHYLVKLEEARCEGRWDEVLELVRKVRKHASDRNCVTAAAEAEHAVIKATKKQSTTSSEPPSTASITELDTEHLVPKLLEAIGGEQTYPEDKFQAQVCLGWVHWTVGEYETASRHLPASEAKERLPLNRPDGVSEWTRVCAIKATYLQAYCLSRNNKTTEALAVFEDSLTTLAYDWARQKGGAQLRFWTELLLTEYCMLQAEALERGEKSLEDKSCLAPFRSWTEYWVASNPQGAPLAGGYGVRGAIPRRRVWNEYYNAISGILQQGLPFPPANLSATNESSARNQLRTELKKVESMYEALLLSETTFPRAEEQREEVEDFVALVMKNWSVLVGPDWHEHDLGPGGKEGLSRGILDLLYRAATKTFHSTGILRSLFTVHLAVAEFDLAFHAFDSYMEIMERGKVRIDKTGHPEPSLDDDATMLETMSQAIIALCKYGFDEAAEKAYHLGVELEDLLQKLPPPLANKGDAVSPVQEENGNGLTLHPRVSPRVNALSWQAVGLSQAHWSRVTFDASIRTDLQTKAIRSLHRSLSPETGNPADTRSLFTLTVLLAEQRKLTAAIDIVKAALMSSNKTQEQKPGQPPYWRERSLIPLWHLLALLLSARQDYVMAARTCEAAFEQFKDPEVLFGSQTLQASFRSQHLNEAEAREESELARGLVDDMDDLEKEGIIEVKMTQLSLLKLLEGPEVAVNASHELLVLYTRLFGTTLSKATPVTITTPSDAPKSSSGTLRSLRGSIFGHKTGEHRRGSILIHDKSTTSAGRPHTAQTAVANPTTAPSIQVTKDSNGLSDSRRPPSVRGRQDEPPRKNSLKKREHSTQQQRTRSSSGVRPGTAVTENQGTVGSETGPAVAGHDFLWRNRKTSSSPHSTSNRGLLSSSKVSANVGGSAFANSLSAPSPLPTIKFSDDQQERQRRTLLVKVWLMIASFYRESKMHGDAKGAIAEAEKVLEGLEANIAKDTSGHVTSRKPGWGGRTCLDELLGDLQTEMGFLAVDEGLPYVAKDCFEEALLRYPDHPSAIVGLSNILLDIYTEVLLPSPTIPGITGDQVQQEVPNSTGKTNKRDHKKTGTSNSLSATPLGLGGGVAPEVDVLGTVKVRFPAEHASSSRATAIDELPAPYKAVSLPLIDRLAARDRAYGLLSSLTKLGKGWNYSDAWFALARAHEESGQLDKAREALWWVVELEEGMGVRDWHCVGVNGYVL
ncbi:hypothetical protein GGS20DRAFT_591993 [Poronia punctata]|nr:hypothetical protein GGS20DRAFT_591993 [Poronia punctata]